MSPVAASQAIYQPAGAIIEEKVKAGSCSARRWDVPFGFGRGVVTPNFTPDSQTAPRRTPLEVKRQLGVGSQAKRRRRYSLIFRLSVLRCMPSSVGGLGPDAVRLSRTCVMNRFSNSRWRPRSGCPWSTISATRRSSWSFIASVELPSGQAPKRLEILVARAHDDIVGQRRHRRLLVPADPLEIVAHVLLVEARLRAARARTGPSARSATSRASCTSSIRISSPRRVAAIGSEAELELRVGQDDAARLGVRRAAA